jgi:predicted peptidase
MLNAQQFEKLSFIDQGDTLLYNRLFPPAYQHSIGDNPEKAIETMRYPLIIFLHGAGERGNDNEIQIIHIKKLFLDENNKEKYPAFVIAPQCPIGKRWVETNWAVSKHHMPKQPSETITLVMKLIDDMLEKYPIDPTRIYVTGLSMGGFGTWDIICRYPDKFAAAIPICGGGDVGKANLLTDIPVWAFHGSADNVVKVNLSRDMIKAIKDLGGNPKYTEYKGVGHNSWENAYKEEALLEWLFKQKLVK